MFRRFKEIPLVKAFVVSSVVDNVNLFLIQGPKKKHSLLFYKPRSKGRNRFFFYQSAMGSDRCKFGIRALSQYPHPLCGRYGNCHHLLVINKQRVYEGFDFTRVTTMLKAFLPYYKLPKLDLIKALQFF